MFVPATKWLSHEAEFLSHYMNNTDDNPKQMLPIPPTWIDKLELLACSLLSLVRPLPLIYGL